MSECFHALPIQKGGLKGVTVKTSNLVFYSLSVPPHDATKGKSEHASFI